MNYYIVKLDVLGANIDQAIFLPSNPSSKYELIVKHAFLG